MIPGLTAITIVTLIVYIIAYYREIHPVMFVTKPLATILIITIALLLANGRWNSYRTIILAGLLCSLAGDIFLMLRSDKFIHGLVSFLLAHICYILAFSIATPLHLNLFIILPFVAYGAIVFFLLRPSLGAMKVPVLLYMTMILIMAVTAWNRYLAFTSHSARLAAIGAVIFILSDTLLAWDRFRHPFHLSRLLVGLTYFPAQWLIALSLG